MKTESRDELEPEAMQVDEPLKITSTPPKRSSSQPSQMMSMKHEEARDDASAKEAAEEREGPPKKATPRKSNVKNSKRRGPYDSSGYPSYPQGGHYPPPGVRPYGPPPPHYGYDPHYRPPHPHSYPPPMHHGQPPGPYSYGPPPPNYHPYGGYPAPMPYPPPPHPMPSSYPMPSDNVSMASSKAKSSKSKLPRKKRTIDQHHYHDTAEDQVRRGHRRTFSSSSTASTLSGGELSLCSSALEKEKSDNPLTRASPKRRRGHDSNPISVVPSFEESSIRRSMSNASTAESSAVRFQKLSVNDHKNRDNQTNIFLTLSTSPIHTDDVDSTPISKNKKKTDDHAQSFISRTASLDSCAEIDAIIDRHGDTPTPPMNSSGTNVMTDAHVLNRHLRGQTFTPVPPVDRESPHSKIGNSSFGGIQPQLSWSIAGDTPSLGDLAEWEEDRQKRPPSTTSQVSSNGRPAALSPSSFTMWKEFDPNNKHRTLSRDESLRLSMLSPNSDMGEEEGGASTPLPFFFSDGQPAEERENTIRGTFSNASDRSANHDMKYSNHHPGYQRVPENVHSIFVSRSTGSASKRSASKSSNGRFFPHSGRSDSNGRGGMRMPPTPIYSEHDTGYGRSHHGRDGPPEGSYYGHYMGPPPPHMHDRVRNLRGRDSSHHVPMPVQLPPPVSSHHTLTSPMGMPNKMWGIPHPSPHHLPPPPMELNPSKRKCVSLKPPIPSKFQGDIEKVKGAPVPEFTALVNYPAHMSQKQSVNLPEGMRCCVMCGQACPCSNSTKTNGSSSNSTNGNKKHPSSSGNKKDAASMEKQSGFAIIPTQNKGLCTLCDVNVWVVCQSGLEIKWCKGCKNFRPWAAFGDKGLATKCLRCRERQREKYALQKEEKDKARVPTKHSNTIKTKV